MSSVKLFVFSSATHENIKRAVKTCRWAVSIVDNAQMRGRYTKSLKMEMGSYGLLYCKECGQFTVPFKTISQPVSPDDVVADIWPEPWGLSFEIEPLGPSKRGENLKAAKDLWPMFKGISNVTRKTPLGGSCAFAACPISEADWKYIVDALGFREGEARE